MNPPSFTARRVQMVLSFTLLVLLFPMWPAKAENLPTLTTVGQIRALSEEQAAYSYPIHLSAVVTYCRAKLSWFVLQDETGACACLKTTPAVDFKARPGQIVTVDGWSSPGGYVANIMASHIEVTGFAPLPEAKPMRYDQLMSGQQACQRVEVRGVVRAIYQQGRQQFVMQIASGGGKLPTVIEGLAPEHPEQWIDSVVRVRGVCSSTFNKQRQLCGVGLSALTLDDVVREEYPSAEPYAAPAKPIRQIMQFVQGSTHDRRVKVSGTVLYHQPGQSCFIEDETSGLEVLSREAGMLHVGDRVEVLGFPLWSEYSFPRLEDAIFRRVGRGLPPKPIDVTAGQLLEGRLDRRLVRLQAQLVEQSRRKGEELLVMKAGEVLFNARLSPSDDGVSSLANDSILSLTGICRLQMGEHRPVLGDWPVSAFELLLPSPDDVHVVKPPDWWTQQRAAWLLAVVTGLLVGAMCWVAMLRHRVRLQTAIISDRLRAEAALNERERIARELHDTVEQDLAAIGMHFEVITDRALELEPMVRENFEAAVRQVRRSQADMHHAVWDLRSGTLVERGLGPALEEALQLSAAHCGAVPECKEYGPVRRLPGVIEHHLLRIGQEAMSNAVRHAAPKRISIALRYEGDTLTMRVEDDGCGFDVEARSQNTARFGLMGMRERVERIGGRLSVQSTPGTGSVVEVVLRNAGSFSSVN
ncbi:histidine kinase [Chthoniobacter flavus Ellin428]|uniref:Histidine kinase n=1 Tax=Chthoniobacter flavus Ellin428 TaxID=497964 RepID=B4D5C3_9BACT|nr:sensor histidine kinase [Chthoniobacter flavus]EDY18328.1 histidine kinase [Chthoniobacter flavus Ellin428]TCO91352.1 histidine kinase/DNA gyrase B/HSP90-like ATPase [Chthoniobacter flavus]